MSPSTKSKPASQSSPATGAESKSEDSRAKDGKDQVKIDLELSRQRWIAWTIGGICGGILLILKLGTVGIWVGVVLIALGILRGYFLAMSLIHPAGSIIVTPTQVTLPRAAHRPKPLVVEPSAITAVYFLRRSVPWNRSSPVLIIELGDNAMVYPRDWFASESDQRQVVHALRAHLPDVRTEPTKADAKAEPTAEPKAEPATSEP
jgi:hypothetical protein